LKRFLITGITGQDGLLLARYLIGLSPNIYIAGTSRNVNGTRAKQAASILEKNGEVLELDFLNIEDLEGLVRYVNPDVIFHFAAQSSVGLSFAEPKLTMNINTKGTKNLLDVILTVNPKIKFYNASSGECFGNLTGRRASETTEFSPVSPYGESKCIAHRIVEQYRQEKGLFACSGLLFNHESPLRPEHFVTKKIVSAAVSIFRNEQRFLTLGDSSIVRDWGWAPEYVEAMYKMVFHDTPTDFVVGTGKSYSLREFASQIFQCLGLSLSDHLRIDKTLFRDREIRESHCDPSRVATELGWVAKKDITYIAESMVEAHLAKDWKKPHA